MTPRVVRLRTVWVEQPWGRMRVWVGGEGPALLAIHGLGGSGRYWAGLIRRVGHRFTVLAPDLAGFGRSDKPRASYDRDFHLAAVRGALERLGADEPVALVGHSLGGVLAALWAARHPSQVRAIALAAAPFPSGAAPAWAGRRPPLPVRALARTARLAWPFVGVPLGVLRGYPPGLVMDFGRQRLESRTRTMRAVLWEPGVRDELEGLRRLAQARVLLAAARDDRTVPLLDLDRWAELFPRAERLVLASGGHQFPLRTDHADLAAWLLAER